MADLDTVEIKMDAFHNDKLDQIVLQLDDQPKNKEEESMRSTLYTDNQFQQTSVNLIDRNLSFSSAHSQSEHRGVVVFTLLFKALAMGSYLLLNLIIRDDILLFILVTLLAAFDFYMVKNISGRLLIGMRWWSDLDEQGKEQWNFESHENTFQPQAGHSSVFWSSLVVALLFWGFFSFLNVLSLKIYWLLVTGIAFSLTGINLWAFFKCSRHHQKKLKNFASESMKTYGSKLVEKMMSQSQAQ